MERYITQLLEDLEQIISYRQASEESLALAVNEEESQDDALELSKLLSTKHCTFAELLDVNVQLLPPEHMLSDEHTISLMDSLSDALMVHNCYLDFPSKLSSRDRYRILRETWNAPQQLYKECMNTIDFCDYDQDNCPFGPGKCQCKDFEDLG